jgi:hypothetical protein
MPIVKDHSFLPRLLFRWIIVTDRYELMPRKSVTHLQQRYYDVVKKLKVSRIMRPNESILILFLKINRRGGAGTRFRSWCRETAMQMPTMTRLAFTAPGVLGC